MPGSGAGVLCSRKNNMAFDVQITLDTVTFDGEFYTIPFDVKVFDEVPNQIYHTVVTLTRAPDNVTLNSMGEEVEATFTSRWEQFVALNITNLTNSINPAISILESDLEDVVN